MTESEKLIENEAEAIDCLKSNKPTSGYLMLQESIDMAIKALEKQIPKKPDFTEDKEFTLCPCCNGNGLADKQEYCDNCGQKLDWSDEE